MAREKAADPEAPGTGVFVTPENPNRLPADELMIQLPDGSIVPFSSLGIDEDAPLPDDGTGEIKLRIPEIRVTYSQSTHEGSSDHVGQFFTTDDEQFHRTILVTPLRSQGTRVMFNPDRENPSPLCMSADGVYPLSDMTLWTKESITMKGWGKLVVPPEPKSCEECPFAEWGYDQEGNRLPPACSDSIDLLVVRHENGRPARIRLHGTALGPFRDWVGSKLKPRKASLLSQVLDLSTKPVKGAGNSWFEIIWNSKDLDRRMSAYYGTVLKEYEALFESVLRDTEAAGDDGEPEPGNPDQWKDA
jgi:hypothetical protein